MSDAQLVTTILNGETGRFEELVERYLPMVRGVCASRASEPGAVDDLVQETFVACFKGLGRLRNPARFGPWLTAIARNTCKTHARSKARREAAHDSLAKSDPRSGTVEPAEELSRRELYEWVRRAIGHLPGKTQEAMVLHYVEGYAVAEIAAMLGVREGAVKKRLQYGRELVSERLWSELGTEVGRKRPDAKTRKRIMAAIPLASAPWLARGASAATLLTPAIVLKGAAALVPLVLLAMWVLPRLAAHVEAPEDLLAQDDRPPAGAAAEESALQGLDAEAIADWAAASAGSEPKRSTLKIRVEFEGWVTENPVSATSGPVLGGVRKRQSSSGEPVPHALIRLIPMQFNAAIFEGYLRNAGVEEKYFPYFLTRFSREARSEEKMRSIVLQVKEDPEGFRAAANMLGAYLEQDESRQGAKQKLARAFSLAPEQEWTECKASVDGVALIENLPCGHYLAYVRDPDESGAWPAPDKSDLFSGSHFVDRGVVKRDIDVLSEGTECTITMQNASAAIRGKVIDAETGEPIPVVNITVTGEAMGGSRGTAQTHEDGEFEIAGMDCGYGDFTIRCESQLRTHGTVTLERRHVPGESEPMTIKMPRLATISGTVRNTDGSSASDVTIFQWDGDGGGMGNTKSDENGHYAHGHEGGTVILSAQSGRTKSERATFELEPGENVTHDFVLPPWGAITLKVKGPWWQVPEELDSVRLFYEGPYESECRTAYPVRNGDLFEIRYVAPDTYMLSFAVEGYEAVVLENLSVAPGKATGPINVKLARPSSRLAVHVLDKQGNPASGATVSLAWVFPHYNREGKRSGQLWHSLSEQSGKTDEDGEYVIEGLPPGLYEVTAAHNKVEVEVPRAEPLTLHKQDPSPPDCLHAKPVPFNASDNKPIYPTESKTYTLSPEGKLSTGRLEVGQNALAWIADGYPAAFETVTVTREMVAKETYPALVRIPVSVGPAGSVYGVVVNAESDPVAGAPVGIVPVYFLDNKKPNVHSSLWEKFARGLARNAKTNEEGAFAVGLLPEGAYVVALSREVISAPFEVKAGHETGPVDLVKSE